MSLREQVSSVVRQKTTVLAGIALAIVCYKTNYVCGDCALEQRTELIRIDNYLPKNINYNVCVDSTVIRPPVPSRWTTSQPVFDRRCCGCRASRFHEHPIELQYAHNPPSLITHIFYLYNILECECVSCNVERLRSLRVSL